MNPQSDVNTTYFQLPEPIDMVAIERRARELRAQAMVDAVRGLAQWTARRAAALRLPAGSRPA